MKYTLTEWRDKVLQHCADGLTSVTQAENNLENDKEMVTDALKQIEHDLFEIIDHLS